MLKKNLKEALTRTDLPAHMWAKDKQGKRFKLLSVIMKGTVFSGHPTRTTLFNTLRVLSYAHFVAYVAGIPRNEYLPHAAGDDLCVVINKKYLKRFKSAYELVYIHE